MWWLPRLTIITKEIVVVSRLPRSTNDGDYLLYPDIACIMYLTLRVPSYRSDKTTFKILKRQTFISSITLRRLRLVKVLFKSRPMDLRIMMFHPFFFFRDKTLLMLVIILHDIGVNLSGSVLEWRKEQFQNSSSPKKLSYPT